MKRRRRSRYIPLPEVDRRIRTRTPDFARLLTSGTADEVRFNDLAPLGADSAWSAVALISPNRSGQNAGLVFQQSSGARAFGFALDDGRLKIEAATQSRTTSLSPPLNQWSHVGVASSADGARVYLGSGSEASVEDVPGLLTARCGNNPAIVIGTIGETFSGAIALVCLFSGKLPDDKMRSIVLGQLDPLFAPKLCFGWIAAAPDQLDMVSRKAPTITGTRIIPFGAAGRTVLYAPAAPNVPRPSVVQPVQQPAPPPHQPAKIERPRVEPARFEAPRVEAPRVEATKRHEPPIGVRVAKSAPAPEPVRSEKAAEEIPEVVDTAAASRSALFRELGLVDDPEERK